MTLPQEANEQDIVLVTPPDFAPLRRGTVLTVVSNHDIQDIMDALMREWPVEDALTVYQQPLGNGEEASRALALVSMSHATVFVLTSTEEANLLCVAATRAQDPTAFFLVRDTFVDDVRNSLAHATDNVCDNALQVIRGASAFAAPY